MKKLTLKIFITTFLLFISNTSEAAWPPQLHQSFPAEMEFYDQTGERVKMFDLKGNILLIEYVGMNCPACQAFSGANIPSIGPFQGNSVQKNLSSIEEYFATYTNGLELSDERVTYVAILLYDMQMGAPDKEDARQWAEHFRFDKKDKEYVLVPTADVRGEGSYNLIPGFHLLDQNLTVRSASAGHNPQQDLYHDLLPIAGKLLEIK